MRATTLAVGVELRGPAWRAADPEGVRTIVAGAIAGLATSLGLAVAPAVEVHTADSTRADGLPLGLRVASRPVRYDFGLWREAEQAAGTDEVAEVAGPLTRHACARRAGVLFGPEQAGAYAEELARLGVPRPDPAWLRDVLGGVLDLGIAVADVTAVAGVLRDRESDHVPIVRETLVARLAAADLRILLPPGIDLDPSLLMAIGSSVADETGIPVPPLRTAPAGDALPAGFFALRVNDVIAPPCPLPSPDSIGLIAAMHLRERIGWCVHEDRLQAQLDAVQEQAPRLVLAARAACPPWQLAVLVRGLAADRIPVNDLPGLLERLIEAAYLDLPEVRASLLGDPEAAIGAYPAPDDRDGRLESFVRTGMRDVIAQTCLGGRETLEAALLDPETGEAVRAETPGAGERLLDEIAGTDPRVLLVGDDLRARVADLLREACPLTRVVAYGDLPADLLVAPSTPNAEDRPATPATLQRAEAVRRAPAQPPPH